MMRVIMKSSSAAAVKKAQEEVEKYLGVLSVRRIDTTVTYRVSN